MKNGTFFGSLIPVVLVEIRTKLDFEANQDDWETFMERLDFYFTANGITDENKQKVIMLTKVSAKTYTLIRDFRAPAKLKDKTFTQLEELMKNHLNPKPSEAVGRCKFNQAVQETGESIAEFCARQRKFAVNCNFTDLNTILRDRLVCGVKDQDTRVLLFQEKDLTFNKAYETAIGQEKARANASVMGSNHTMESSPQEINLFKKRKNLCREKNNIIRIIKKVSKSTKTNRWTAIVVGNPITGQKIAAIAMLFESVRNQRSSG